MNNQKEVYTSQVSHHPCPLFTRLPLLYSVSCFITTEREVSESEKSEKGVKLSGRCEDEVEVEAARELEP